MNAPASAAPPPEFSRPVQVDRVGREGLNLEIEAGPKERDALARRFGLMSLKSLTARCRLRSVAGGMIELTATFQAEVEQECVVTLEPVPARVEASFEQRYAGGLARLRPSGPEELIDMEAEDPPEAIEEGMIDLGEAVAQELAVALDPFPRAPGVTFEGAVAQDLPEAPAGRPKNGGNPPSQPNPFEALARLKEKR